MTLRSVGPLDDEQWAKLLKAMKEGPPVEQTAKIAAAIERGKKIRRKNYRTFHAS